jgi:hypothetical protein
MRFTRFKLLTQWNDDSPARRILSGIEFVSPEPVILNHELNVFDRMRRFVGNHSRNSGCIYIEFLEAERLGGVLTSRHSLSAYQCYGGRSQKHCAGNDYSSKFHKALLSRVLRWQACRLRLLKPGYSGERNATSRAGIPTIFQSTSASKGLSSQAAGRCLSQFFAQCFHSSYFDEFFRLLMSLDSCDGPGSTPSFFAVSGLRVPVVSSPDAV